MVSRNASHSLQYESQVNQRSNPHILSNIEYFADVIPGQTLLECSRIRFVNVKFVGICSTYTS